MRARGRTSPLSTRLKISMLSEFATASRFFTGSTANPTMCPRPVFGPLITRVGAVLPFAFQGKILRSEEHTSELQSRENLVCRLLLEKKKKKITNVSRRHTES